MGRCVRACVRACVCACMMEHAQEGPDCWRRRRRGRRSVVFFPFSSPGLLSPTRSAPTCRAGMWLLPCPNHICACGISAMHERKARRLAGSGIRPARTRARRHAGTQARRQAGLSECRTTTTTTTAAGVLCETYIGETTRNFFTAWMTDSYRVLSTHQSS